MLILIPDLFIFYGMLTCEFRTLIYLFPTAKPFRILHHRCMFFLDYTRSGTLRRMLVRPLAKLFIRFRYNEFHPVPFGLMSRIAQDKTPVFHGTPTLILILEDRRGVSAPPTDVGVCGQNMAKFTLKDRFLLPSYDNPKQMRYGRL